ncbi:MAG: radical SAM protein [Helicobacteraceae bacterium]|nr:radical SAM protein [Helicobacteraceae bacterium]
MKKTTLQIDGDTALNLPKNLEFVEFSKETLILAPERGNFIACFNKEQLEIFKNLQQNSINEAEKKAKNKDDFNFIVGQILDREFFEIPLKLSDEYDTAQVYLTNACNLACPHCYMNSRVANKNELSLEEWLSVIDSLKKCDIREIIFSGGEILLNKDYFKIIKYAKELGFIIRLKSNGTLWSADKIREIANFIDDIQISLDGINEEMNSKIRGKGSFEKALFTIKEFSKCGVKVIVATTPTYKNLKEIESGFVEFAKNLLKECENLRFIVSQKMLGGRGISMKFDEAAKEYAKITDSIMDKLYPNYKLKNLSIDIERKERVRNYGYGGLSISSDGGIYLCNRIDELAPIANIKQDFLEIIKRAREFNKKSSVDFVEPCKNCGVRYICGGGCRIDEYNFKGDFRLVDSNLSKDCSKEKALRFKQNLLGGLKYIYGF